MTTAKSALTYTQEIYFDVCDLLNGCTYTSLGYDNRTDCLTSMRDKLLLVEQYINNTMEEENEEA